MGEQNERFKDAGALWIKENKKGDMYMGGSITIDGVKYPIYVQENKKNKDTQPDYRISIDTEKIEAVKQAVTDKFYDEKA